MDRPEKTDARDERFDPDMTCPVCGARGKALVGADEEVRQARLKCRKCDEEFWENQATGMVNVGMNDIE